MYSVNFHPYYRGEGKQVVKDEAFFTNYETITYPDDIYSHNNNHIVQVCPPPPNIDLQPPSCYMLQLQANRKILTPLVELKSGDRPKWVDMIMVGPVSSEPHKVSSKCVCVCVSPKVSRCVCACVRACVRVWT